MTMAKKLIDGYDWNPLRGLPRNMQCPCDSGKKFKNCCLHNLPPAIPEKLAQEYRIAIKQVRPEEIKFNLKDFEEKPNETKSESAS